MIIKTKYKIRLARFVQVLAMGARRLLGRGPITLATRHGITWELDLREGIDFSIWLLGSFEPETVRCYQRLIKPGDVVLDIGANIGAHTPLLAQAAGAGGKAIAFEPTDYAFAKLTRNIALNPALASRVQCLQTMLGDTNSTASRPPPLYSSWPLKDEEGLHTLHQGRLMTTAGASLRTLDSVLASMDAGPVACIKLDIDGAECGMLRGASQTLSRWRPVIIMELAPYMLEEHSASLGELIGLLKSHGYALFDAVTGRLLEMNADRLQEIIPPGASLNVVARVP